jgi:N,N-dimethylformamidase
VEEVSFTVQGVSAVHDPQVRADVVYHVRPGGGAVFSTGSIAWAGSLGIDDGVSRITLNVIKRFEDPRPLTW